MVIVYSGLSWSDPQHFAAGVAVQALAVLNAAGFDVLVDEALDITIVIPRTHVVCDFAKLARRLRLGLAKRRCIQKLSQSAIAFGSASWSFMVKPVFVRCHAVASVKEEPDAFFAATKQLPVGAVGVAFHDGPVASRDEQGGADVVEVVVKCLPCSAAVLGGKPLRAIVIACLGAVSLICCKQAAGTCGGVGHIFCDPPVLRGGDAGVFRVIGVGYPACLRQAVAAVVGERLHHPVHRAVGHVSAVLVEPWRDIRTAYMTGSRWFKPKGRRSICQNRTIPFAS